MFTKNVNNTSIYLILKISTIINRVSPPYPHVLYPTVQFSSVTQSFLTLCDPMDCSTQGFPVHHQLTLRAYLMSIELVMPSNHLILCCPLLLPPSIFPSSRVFWNEWVLHIRWPSTGVSASTSVLPMNIQDWFPLGWTGWISLLSKGLKSLPQHHSSKASILWHSAFFISPTLTSIHDYWKNHSFDYTDLCWQSNVSAFEYAV